MKISMQVAGAMAGLMLAAGSAQAATVVTKSIGVTLTTGQTYSGQFDISSYLTGFEVVSAQVVANAISASNPFTQVSDFYGRGLVYSETVVVTPGYTSYEGTCFFGGCYVPPVMGEDRHFEAYRDRTTTDALDVLSLDVGEGQGVGLTTLSHSEGAYHQIGGYVYAGTNGTGGKDYVITAERNVYDLYAGPFSATAGLTANDLAGLNSTGLLNYTLKASPGTTYLQGARLEFDLREITAGVPEPGTWAMMIVGFGLLGSTLRRRRAAGALAA